MALGNANASAQARGKSKAVKVKRRKQVVEARAFHSVTSSPVQASDACRFDDNALTETFYHDGNSALPARDDVVYLTKRANRKTVVEAGHYKIVFGGRNHNMQVGANGVASRITKCR